MLYRLIAVLIILSGGSASPSAAQSARDAAARFLDAWNAKNFPQAAQALDLDQFDRFRRDFINRARQANNEGPRLTVDDLLKREPDMPREVAEYQVRQMEEQRRRYADPTPFEFARVASISALRALSPAEAAARWLESRDPRWQVKMQFEQAGCPAPDDVNQIPTPARRLLGIVPDGDSASYAVFKEEQPDSDSPAWTGGDVSVMELRQRGGRWAVMPKADLVPEIGQVDVSSCRGNQR